MCRVPCKPTQCPRIDSFVELTLCRTVPAPCKLFVSAFLSGSQMSSITSSWCWGFVPCCRRSPGRQWHLLHPTSSPVSMTNSHLLCCQQEQTEEHTVEEQRIALCQLRVPMIFVNFGEFCEFRCLWCLISSCDFLWSWDPAVLLPQLAEESPFFMLKSGLQQTPLKAILILKASHTQPNAAEHFDENVGHNHQVSAEYRMHRNSQFCQEGAFVTDAVQCLFKNQGWATRQGVPVFQMMICGNESGL